MLPKKLVWLWRGKNHSNDSIIWNATLTRGFWCSFLCAVVESEDLLNPKFLRYVCSPFLTNEKLLRQKKKKKKSFKNFSPQDMTKLVWILSLGVTCYQSLHDCKSTSNSNIGSCLSEPLNALRFLLHIHDDRLCLR